MPTAVMTEPTAPPLPVPAPRRIGLRILLILAALFEAFDAYSSLFILFGDMSEIPGPGFGGFLIKAQLASHLPLALAALPFAAIGRVRYAIMALAAVVVMTWLNYMPSVVRPHGFEFSGFYGTIETTAQIIAFPLMAACAIAWPCATGGSGLPPHWSLSRPCSTSPVSPCLPSASPCTGFD